MLDKERIIAEVAARNGIRIESGDPIFAVLTVTQLALDDAGNEIEEKVRALMSEFEANIRAVERLAGRGLGDQARNHAAVLKRELRSDIDSATAKATELVTRVQRAHERPNIVMWASIGLLCAVALFCSGVWFGRFTAVS
jgi:hypothetical protein